mgnify:CR=1 FL=1
MMVQGFAQDRFAGVKEVLAANLASGADIGASFCATINGETVVDIWGGHADPEKTRPWERDTIINVYSTTKTMAALTALLLADRGVIDLHAPVARYWPEFAAGGKQDVTVAHLLSHSAGLSGWKEPIAKADFYDWDKCTSLLAEQEPFWAPGSKPGYHAVTQGYLVGEVIRRATGKSIGTVFREEIAEPLGAERAVGVEPLGDVGEAALQTEARDGRVGDGELSAFDPVRDHLAEQALELDPVSPDHLAQLRRPVHPPEEDPGVVGKVAGKDDDLRFDHGCQALRRVEGRVLMGGLDPGDCRAVDHLHPGEIEGLLGREVVVQRCLADVDRGSDVVEGGAGVAGDQKLVTGRAQDLRAAARASRFEAFGGRGGDHRSQHIDLEVGKPMCGLPIQ